MAYSSSQLSKAEAMTDPSHTACALLRHLFGGRALFTPDYQEAFLVIRILHRCFIGIVYHYLVDVPVRELLALFTRNGAL